MLTADLRAAARRLRRSPTLTAAIIGTLALTIGATTMVHTVVQRVLLDPLPLPDSDRLVWIDHAGPGIGAARGLGLTQGIYGHYRELPRSLQGITVYSSADRNVVSGDAAERLEVTQSTASFASTLGVVPVLGRFFSDAEDVIGGAPVTVVSHGYWSRHLGGRASAIGEFLSIDGERHEVIGVMPASLDVPSRETALWVPLRMDPASSHFGSFSLMGIGRMAPGATARDAARDLDAVIPRIAEAFPDAAATIRSARLQAIVVPLKDHLVGDVRRTLWILFGAVAFVLVIAVANLTGLFVVRAESRERELAVRLALGARRSALLRHFLSESLLLATTGGALGLLIGGWALRLLRASDAANLPRREAIALDGVVLAAVGLVVALVAVAFALPPLLRRPGVAAVLRDAGRGLTSGRHRVRGRVALVAGQVALAVVLLVGAGLMLRSFARVRQVDPGFDPANVLTFQVGLTRSAYQTPERAALAFDAILTRLRALPGVTGAGAVSCLPFCQRWNGDAWIAEDRPLSPGENPPVGATRLVSDGYIEALRVPLVSGRSLTAADDRPDARVAVISAQLAHRLWPGEQAVVGRRISNDPANGLWLTVIGVVANTPIRDATEDPAPMVYLPLLSGVAGGPWQLSVVVRTALDPDGIAAAVRREVAAVDPTIPVARVQTLERIIASAGSRMALATMLMVAAAGVALLLGAVGIYGVIAFVVGRRMPEFGLRLALGASRRDILALLGRQGGAMVGAGLVIGLGGALALSGLLRAMLFRVAPRDPLTFGVATLVIGAAALVALWLPARRAMRVDPAMTIRSE